MSKDIKNSKALKTKRIPQTISIPKLDSAEEYCIYLMGVKTAYEVIARCQQLTIHEVISMVESVVEDVKDA